MEENLILTYFDIIFDKNTSPITLKVKLKDVFKTKIPPTRPDGRPYSGVTLQYYQHYLGNELGAAVHTERKRLCSKQKLIDWYLNTHTLDDIDQKLLLTEKLNINKRVSDSLQKHYKSSNSEQTRQKLKERSKKHSERIGKINSEKWKDPLWKTKEMARRQHVNMYERTAFKNKQRMLDNEFKRKFIEACNNPDRTKKISTAAKKMWQEARKHDADKFHRMIQSQKNKNFCLDSYYMNSIEYQVGLLLNDMKVAWRYEPILHFNDQSFIPDFIINDNVIIECFGDFWHANPKYFNPTDTTHKTKTAADVWKHDNKKLEILKENSYNVIVLWESEIVDNIEYCKQKIKEVI